MSATAAFRWSSSERQRASVETSSPSVVEQRAPASECRDLLALRWSSSERQRASVETSSPSGGRAASASERGVETLLALRWSSSERQRAGVGTSSPSGGRAASASERVSRPPRGCGSSSVEGGSNRERDGAWLRLRPGWRVCFVGSADPTKESGGRACRDHDVEGSRKFRNTSPQPPGTPHSRPGTVGARCQNSLYGNGIRRTRGAPGRGPGRTGPRRPRPARGPAALVDERHRAGPVPRLGGRAAAPVHRARAPGRHPGRPPRPRRPSRCRGHQQLLGQHHPADQTRHQRRLALATALDHDHEPVRDAMAAGQVSEDQPS
jgi:hypothetical protein